MGLNDQRVIFDDDGTLVDHSVVLGDYRSGSASFPYVAADDYLYIASFMPFNHKYLDIGTANDETSTLAVHIWDGTTWAATTDILDGTSVSGDSLAQSGIIRWTTDRLSSGWLRELDSFEVTGLSGTSASKKIYNMYWVRFSWNNNLDVATTINYLGHKFSSDTELYGRYPDLNQAALKTAFLSGKTDWENEAYVAADTIIRDLRKKESLFSADQILDYELFNEASIHKTAEIIFHGLGASYKDLKEAARKEYLDAFELGYLNLDINANATLDVGERSIRTGYFHR